MSFLYGRQIYKNTETNTKLSNKPNWTNQTKKGGKPAKMHRIMSMYKLSSHSHRKKQVSSIVPQLQLYSLFCRFFSDLPSFRNAFGIAFDIDGVLLRGNSPIGGSLQALRKLYTPCGEFFFSPVNNYWFKLFFSSNLHTLFFLGIFFAMPFSFWVFDLQWFFLVIEFLLREIVFISWQPWPRI